MQPQTELKNLLQRIDKKGYPAYKDTKGSYDFKKYIFSIDHVQGDPFASPSKVSVYIRGEAAGFPAEYYREKECRIALADDLLRRFGRNLRKASGRPSGSGKSGLLFVTRPGQEILERSALEIDEKNGGITVRFEIGFPANGRTINARELVKIIYEILPPCIFDSLYYAALNAKEVERVYRLAKDQMYIRQELKHKNLAAFVANGAVLPRESGISGLPMKGAVAFVSPPSMETELNLPYHGTIKGMGIKRGITLIVGGGYHGKSTLLKALESGVYPHIAGDGREFVITEESAVKLRAEDGRSIKRTDISMFISNLPNKKDTVHFYTEDASGSTSQAAGVVESIEAGAKTFLMDEDTSATNFMIRDELMQRVVNRESEPITPFIDRVGALYTTCGISTILVAGSSGSYFHKADCVIQMNHYKPYEITENAKQAAEQFPMVQEEALPWGTPDFQRIIKPDKSFRDPRFKIKTMGLDGITLAHDTIDVRYLEQLADNEQLNLLGYLMKYAQCHVFDGKKMLSQVVDALVQRMEERGIASVCDGSYVPCNLAAPRRQEIFAAFNRYRKLML